MGLAARSLKVVLRIVAIAPLAGVLAGTGEEAVFGRTGAEAVAGAGASGAQTSTANPSATAARAISSAYVAMPPRRGENSWVSSRSGGREEESTIDRAKRRVGRDPRDRLPARKRAARSAGDAVSTRSPKIRRSSRPLRAGTATVGLSADAGSRVIDRGHHGRRHEGRRALRGQDAREHRSLVAPLSTRARWCAARGRSLVRREGATAGW